MTWISRREFGIIVGALPIGAVVQATRLAASASLTLGVSTTSFRELPRVEGRDNIDDVIRALGAARAAHVELALANVEPAPPSVAPRVGGTPAYPQLIVLTPEEVAATNARARAALRAWRLEPDAAFLQAVRSKFTTAGITIHACTTSYDASFTDEEIDATFRQVKTLGVGTVSSPLTMAMAVRLAPFAERHQVSVAIHNQVDRNTEEAIATPDLHKALALSRAFALKLDIGNLTASNRDAVAVLDEHRARVSHVILKDRLRNGGKSQPFGEGDTPIPAVLDALRTVSSIPAFVDCDYAGVRSPVDEVATAVAYVTRSAK